MKIASACLACLAAVGGLASVAQADVFNTGPGLTSLETVPVGNVSNTGDPETGYGGVINCTT
jgi:hypothetical protein